YQGTSGDVLSMFAPNLAIGSGLEIHLGVSNSNNNVAVIEFDYSGNNSINNALGFGFWNNNRIMQIFGTGNVNIASNIDSTSTTTGSLTCTGGISSRANIVSNNILDAQSVGIVWEDQTLTTLNTASTTNTAGYSYTQNNYITLTTAAGNQHNSIYWQQNPGHSWSCNFDIWWGSGTGADGISFAVYQTSVPSDCYTNNGGFIVTFTEYNNKIQINTPSSGIIVISSSYTSIVPASTWAKVFITFTMGLLRVYVNGNHIGYAEVQDVASVTEALNTYIAITGSTGGLNNIHRVRNVEMYKDSFNNIMIGGSLTSNTSNSIDYNTPFTFTNTFAGPSPWTAAFLSPNTTNSSFIRIGQSASNGNCAEIGLKYFGNNSASNTISIGIYGGGGSSLTLGNNSQANLTGALSVNGSNTSAYSVAHTINNTATVANPFICGFLAPNMINSSTAILLGHSASTGNTAQISFAYAGNNSPSNGISFGLFGVGSMIDMTFAQTTINNNLRVNGSLTKGSGSFDIPHPDPSKQKKKYRLRHCFVESNTRGDNLY